MSTYLHCTVGRGQLGGEWAVRCSSYSGEQFSLFVPNEFVEAERDEGGAGWLRVDILQKDGARALVRLPAPTFENGHTVTVGLNQIKTGTPAAGG